MRSFYKPFFLGIPFVFCLCLHAFPAKATVEVIMVGGTSFVPATGVTINLGDTIMWQWDNGSHTTTSTTIPSGAAAWDEPINSSASSFIYVPTVPGVYAYKCTPHESMGMLGTFTVVCVPPGVPMISPAGTVNGCVGDSSTMLAITAEAGSAIQWKLNGSAINGATMSQHLPAASGSYTCMVSNDCGSEESAPVVVTLEPSPEPSFTYTQTELSFTFENTTASTDFVWSWDFGDGMTSDEASPVHTYGTAGAYMVTLTAVDTAGNGCAGMVTETVEAQTSGIRNQEKSGLVKISPNPASGWVFISIPEESVSLRLYDLSGKVCLSEAAVQTENGSAQLDISSVTSGLYFLQIQFDDQVVTRKLSVR